MIETIETIERSGASRRFRGVCGAAERQRISMPAPGTPVGGRDTQLSRDASVTGASRFCVDLRASDQVVLHIAEHHLEHHFGETRGSSG
jgi:hypothetical protein